MFLMTCFFLFFRRSFGAGCLQFCCWHSCMWTRWSLATGTGTSPQFCPQSVNEWQVYKSKKASEMTFFQENTQKTHKEKLEEMENHKFSQDLKRVSSILSKSWLGPAIFFCLASCSIEVWFQSSLVWNTLQLHWRSENCQNFVRHRNRSHVKLPSWLSWSQILQIVWFPHVRKEKHEVKSAANSTCFRLPWTQRHLDW